VKSQPAKQSGEQKWQLRHLIISPCVFVLYVETREDVEAFREFRRSSEVVPLREDIEKYSNCASEWTVAKVTA
jgi:hypothetical protein